MTSVISTCEHTPLLQSDINNCCFSTPNDDPKSHDIIKSAESNIEKPGNENKEKKEETETIGVVKIGIDSAEEIVTSMDSDSNNNKTIEHLHDDKLATTNENSKKVTQSHFCATSLKRKDSGDLQMEKEVKFGVSDIVTRNSSASNDAGDVAADITEIDTKVSERQLIFSNCPITFPSSNTTNSQIKSALLSNNSTFDETIQTQTSECRNTSVGNPEISTNGIVNQRQGQTFAKPATTRDHEKEEAVMVENCPTPNAITSQENDANCKHQTKYEYSAASANAIAEIQVAAPCKEETTGENSMERVVNMNGSTEGNLEKR